MQREFQSAGLFYEMENMLGSLNKNLEVEDRKDNIITSYSQENDRGGWKVLIKAMQQMQLY